MSIEENKKLVRRYFEDAPYNPNVCDEIFASTFQFHAIAHTGITAQTTVCTPESEKAFYGQHKSTWGGWHLKIEEMIAEGDRVMVRWSSSGKHMGEVLGISPTGKQVTNSGINIFRVADGKIAEAWDIFDRLWLWQQLGVLPDIKDAIADAKLKQTATATTRADT